MRSLALPLVLILLAVTSHAAEHPRLFFSAADIPALRAKISSGIHQQMYQRLLDDQDSNEWGSAAWSSTVLYDVANRAMRRAFLYVLTGDDSHAQAARSNVQTLLDDSAWASTGVSGLRLYMIGTKAALAYDWCYGAPSWDNTFSATVSTKLLAMADVIRTSGGKSQNTDSASNWQGSRGASGGLCYLATDDNYPADSLTWCYNKVKTYITANLGTGSGDSHGWNIEGLGYNFYPWGNFIGPFGAALATHDPSRDLRQACSAAPWTLWTTYAATVKIHGGLYHPDFGDDNANATHEGTAGMAYWWCPEALHPGMVHWYTRMLGAQGTGNYDAARGGTVWSILFHPGEAVAEQDPLRSELWRQGFSDATGNGMFTYRNAYQDENDIVAQLYLKLRGNKGHNGPDGLSFRLFGLDSAFATGGGRYGTQINGQDAYLRSMNSLYPVNPDATLSVSGDSGTVVGTPQILANGGGSVVGSVARSNLNVHNWKRRFLADYSSASGAEAVFVISDSSDDGIFWQLCTLQDYSLSTAGNTFTITGNGGNTLRGTVLYQAGAIQFSTGTRVRGSDFISNANRYVHFQSTDGKFLVVLTLARKGDAHPNVTAEGTWNSAQPSGTVHIGGLSVRIDGDQIGLQNNNGSTRAMSMQVTQGGVVQAVEIQHSQFPTITGSIQPDGSTRFQGLAPEVDHHFILVGNNG